LDLAGVDDQEIEISVPRGRRVACGGITVHRVLTLDAVDITVVDAIPTTTPTRTMIDLAAVVSPDIVEEALDDALRRRLTTIARLRWRLSELGRKGRPGIAVIRRLVDARSNGGGIPQSVLETRLLRLIGRARLPAPECQYRIREGGRLVAVVDFAYPEARLAIEADGFRWHSGRARWEHDLRRRNELMRLGWRVFHVTATDIEQRGHETVRTIADALRAQQSS
jgi:very-short-patch-repair endonuclease